MKRLLGAIGASLALFLALAYRQGVPLPFVNDDYVFLDKVRHASFLELWTSGWNFFGWWRPLSREVHYWTLSHVLGLWSPAYHLASFALWIASLVLYAALVHRLAGATTAAIATACVAALALWGAPLVWTAGAQDLWMLVFALAYLLAIARGSLLGSALFLLAALLSKETSAMLPAIGAAYLVIVERRPFKSVLAATAASWLVLLVWFALHPTLQDRLFGPLRVSPESETRPALPDVARKAGLALVNLDAAPHPDRALAPLLASGLLAGIVLAAPLLSLWRRSRAAVESRARAEPRRVIAFGLVWAALASTVLFAPSIAWHAYYGSLGTFGFWLAAAVFLSRARPIALATIVALALLREARAATPSTDWGTYWFQARAGRILLHTHEQLFRLHPTLPSGSRLFFMLVPNDIGLLGGDGPAIRVWYDDPTIEAGFLSAYRERAVADTSGRDFFFRFDAEDQFVEVHTGPETPAVAIRGNERWKRDHDVLASTFIRAGSPAEAAGEYAKIFAFYPGEWRNAVYAAAAFEAVGDTVRADLLYGSASRRTGIPETALRQRARPLVRNASTYRRNAELRTP